MPSSTAGLNASRDRIRAALEAAKLLFELKTYPGVDHAFFNDERPEVYSPDAASDAWRRTLSFLRAHLR